MNWFRQKQRLSRRKYIILEFDVIVEPKSNLYSRYSCFRLFLCFYLLFSSNFLKEKEKSMLISCSMISYPEAPLSAFDTRERLMTSTRLMEWTPIWRLLQFPSWIISPSWRCYRSHAQLTENHRRSVAPKTEFGVSAQGRPWSSSI